MYKVTHYKRAPGFDPVREVSHLEPDEVMEKIEDLGDDFTCVFFDGKLEVYASIDIIAIESYAFEVLNE